MAGCGGEKGKRLRHPSPKNIRDGSEEIHDSFRDIRDGPEDIHDGPKNIRDYFKNIHDSPEEEWIEAQPPSRPLPAL